MNDNIKKAVESLTVIQSELSIIDYQYATCLKKKKRKGTYCDSN